MKRAFQICRCAPAAAPCSSKLLGGFSLSIRSDLRSRAQCPNWGFCIAETPAHVLGSILLGRLAVSKQSDNTISAGHFARPANARRRRAMPFGGNEEGVRSRAHRVGRDRNGCAHAVACGFVAPEAVALVSDNREMDRTLEVLLGDFHVARQTNSPPNCSVAPRR